MKNLKIFIPVALLLLACNGHENDTAPEAITSFQRADVKLIKGTDAVTNFEAYLTDLGGQEITDLIQLKPNTLYKLVINGDAPAYYRIKFSDGFTTVDNPAPQQGRQRLEEGIRNTERAIFTIKTHDDIQAGIYVNIVPLRRNGSELTRERSKNFLFPARPH